MRLLINRSFFSVKKTQLYDMHITKKGKMVEFAGIVLLMIGYQMSVQYPTGISNSTCTVGNMLRSSMFRTWDKFTLLVLIELSSWKE